MTVPFLGRLGLTEYLALVGSFLLVGLEAFIRVLTLALPSSLLSLFYRASRRLFDKLTTPAQKRAELRRSSISSSLRNASDFVDLCRIYGYEAEEHIVQTKDGYLLGLHRLAWRPGEENKKVNSGRNGLRKRVVYLHHGLLMNSEVWVCLTDANRCLPFVLVDRGFDVWLGNNRGNKYSKKSVNCQPSSTEFWNFSMDEFAFHDIPDSIAYVLETTGQASLSYIGFSQGTAQAFAALSIHPKLNNQVNVFIALAPAMSPTGLSNGIVDALVKASPQVLFLLFGRRSILSSATTWQSILYPPIFVRIIDASLGFLFDWQTKNISMSQKLASYPHLYSFTSTKSVVHWFQVIRNKSFQMYDDDLPPISLSTSNKYTKVAKYPARNIKTPVVLVYGGSDSLVDIKAMLKELPPQTVATEIPHYEHLDFLWARDVDTQVFQHVFDALESFTDAEHTKEEYARYQLARQESLNSTAFAQVTRPTSIVKYGAAGALENGQENGALHKGNVQSLMLRHQHQAREKSTAIPSPKEGTRVRTRALHVADDDTCPSSPDKPSYSPRPARATESENMDGGGWGSLSPSPLPRTCGSGLRRGSGGSTLSVESMREGRGINIGAARTAGGVVTICGAEGRGIGPGLGSSSTGVDPNTSRKKK